ncbi:MAG: alkaline phosphatase family protein [Candidatus Sericytochromatia bacterium]|nr:alkaline phosphatase family protein [Candidatus Tanganyikabacteria bacterium]
MASRPVHILIVSGLSPEALRAGLRDSVLESAAFLAKAGALREDCVAPFPSVAPTSVATLATGLTPREHGILGRAWYDRLRRRVHKFDPARELAAPAAPTLATRLAEAGLRFLSFGVPVGCGGTGLGVGQSDADNARLTREAIASRGADLTVTLLRDTDDAGHAAGPGFTMPALARADRALGHLLAGYGDPAEAVVQARWIVVGDHGFSPIFVDRPGEAHSHAARPGDLVLGTAAEIVPNGRAAFAYVADAVDREAYAAELSALPCVDQVFWRAGEWVHGRKAALGLRWAAGQGASDARDQCWRTEGDLAVVGMAESGGRLVESAYPDALRRVADLLRAEHAPDLVATAREGYEFTTGRHRGNHGSLTAADSVVPLIAAGFGPLPALTRTADVARLAAAAMDVPELVLSGSC